MAEHLNLDAYQNELTYLNTLRDVYLRGYPTEDRTGVGTRRLFGKLMEFDLNGDRVPLMTTKRIAYKSLIAELVFFMRGETNVKFLQERGCTIWDEWARPDGELGPIYGAQWRQWRRWKCYDGSVYDIDQLYDLVKGLQLEPTSRRLILSAWNVGELDFMALPPCHVMSQWTVIDGKVQVALYQRSGDMFLGVPFNIASYAIFAHAVAASVGLKASKLVHFIADAHVYDNHRDQVKEQLDRKCLPCNPHLLLKKDVKGKGPWTLDVDDFEIVDYKHHKSIKAPVAV